MVKQRIKRPNQPAWMTQYIFHIEMGRRDAILLEDTLCAFCENNGIIVIA